MIEVLAVVLVFTSGVVLGSFLTLRNVGKNWDRYKRLVEAKRGDGDE